MSPLRRRLVHATFKLADLAAMVASFVAAAALLAGEVYELPIRELFAMRIKVSNALVFAALLTGWHLSFTVFGLYRSRRLSSRWSEVLDVVKATSVGSLLTLAASFFFQIDLVTTDVLVLFWILSTSSIVVLRLLLRTGLEQARLHGRNLRHVLVVGTNDRARAFASRLQSRKELGYRVVGFVDEEWAGVGELRRRGLDVVSGFDGLKEFLRTNVVDEVVMALPIASFYHQSARIVRVCEEQGIKVRFLSNFFNLNLAQATVEMFQGEPVLLLHTGPPEGWQSALKRILDVTLSGIALLALSPIFLLVAGLIKLSSPGPIFFAQERVGLNKRKFQMWKFRTMVQDAERRLAEIEHLNEISGPVFKIKNDPRITPIGRLLRRTSIDELPQLFSVIRGDMSLVGPRPLPMRDYEGFDQDWHRRRFSVRPGVTCLWQVAGRNDIPFERWMELDMEYIDRWSLWLDFKILFLTIPAVLRGSGAS